jgi:acyl carrier protein
MSDTERTVIDLVTGILSSRRPGTVVTADSAMGSPTEWDSLAFVEIFTTVSEHFSLDVADDDAINFMSVAEIVAFVDSSK